jgi:hypothetical protein
MFVGAGLGRLVLDRMSDRTFARILEGLVMAVGLLFLLAPPR